MHEDACKIMEGSASLSELKDNSLFSEVDKKGLKDWCASISIPFDATDGFSIP